MTRHFETRNIASPAIRAMVLALMLALGMALGINPPLAWSAGVSETSLAVAQTASTLPFAGGNGTADNPFTIKTADQLRAFRDAVNAGNTYDGQFIALVTDMDISDASWIPIGASTRKGSGVESGSTPFSGTFDGGGHSISGLTIAPVQPPANGADYALGLFGAVMGGTVRNFSLEGVSIQAPNSELAGGAVGLLGNGGTVSSISVNGTIAAKCGTGGIVGRMTARGTIAQCTNNAAVTVTGGSGNCGGIVGAAYYSPENAYMAITDCVNNATITGVNDTGGIAGLCCAFVAGCTNKGPINGSGYAVGGIAGELKNHGGITHCTNNAAVDNASDAKPYGTGGIVGWVRYDGAAPAYALSAPAVIADNLNTAAVTAKTGVGAGGIVGVLYSAGTVTGNQNNAPQLGGNQFIGGIVGNLQNQSASTLPPSVPQGAQVTNNVSTTPLSAMAGTLRDTIAYNNDPSLFTVKDNGEAWMAQRSSTGATLYASLPATFAAATNGDTITLIANSTATKMLKNPTGFDVTFDLNGHSIEFSPDGGITADGGTITVTGSGDVCALNADGSVNPAPTLFATTTPIGGSAGKVLLKGGTYPVDVSPFVAPGFLVKKLDAPNAAGNQYEVVAEQPTNPTTPDQPVIPTPPASPTTPNPTPDPVVPTTPVQTGDSAHKTPTPQKPGAAGTSKQPAASDLPGASPAASTAASQVQASTKDARPATKAGTTPQTTDGTVPLTMITSALGLLAAATIIWTARKRSRHQE